MKVLRVIDKLKIGKNTLVAVDDPCNDIKNGDRVLGDDGRTYAILSIGTNSNKSNINITNILIEGDFKSKNIFI